MNRRERRSTEKKLGIAKHVKHMSRNEKFERIRQNIVNGNRKQDEMKDSVRVSTNKKNDEVDNNKIASKATELMVKEGLDYIDALEKAQQIYK